MQVGDPDSRHSITLQCASSQVTLRSTKPALVLAVGARTPLNNTGLHERLRCQGCGNAPTNVWLSWQEGWSG
jgi:hypothetical protein